MNSQQLRSAVPERKPTDGYRVAAEVRRLGSLRRMVLVGTLLTLPTAPIAHTDVTGSTALLGDAGYHIGNVEARLRKAGDEGTIKHTAMAWALESVGQLLIEIYRAEQKARQAKAPPLLALRPTPNPKFVTADQIDVEIESNGTDEQTEAAAIVEAYLPDTAPGTDLSFRTYLLNVAGEMAPGQIVNLVEFIDPVDYTYDARVSLDEGFEHFYVPQDMTASRDGRTLVVASRGSPRSLQVPNPTPPHLAIVDTTSASVTRRILLPDDTWPTDVVLSPDGETAYVLINTLMDNGAIEGATLLYIDLASGAVTNRYDSLTDPNQSNRDLALTPDGGLLFVLTSVHLSVFDTRTRTLVEVLGERTNVERFRFSQANEIAMHPHGTRLLVSDARYPDIGVGLNGVMAINTSTLEIETEGIIPDMQFNHRNGLAVSSDGRYVTHLAVDRGIVTILDSLTLDVLFQTSVSDNQGLFRGTVGEGP